MLRSNKNSLKSLIDKIDWQSIEFYKRGANDVREDQITIAFNKKIKGKGANYKIGMRIGSQVLEELGWTYGDKICPMYDPDDEMTFLLIKPHNPVGFGLVKELKAGFARLNFPFTGKTILEPMASTIIDYEIHKGQLIFRAIRIESDVR